MLLVYHLFLLLRLLILLTCFYLERILVDEIFFSSRSFMMWDVQLRRLSNGFLVKLSQGAQAYPSQ
jgi:hypothetical protein